MPRKKPTTATTEDDYITFADGRTMPIPEAEPVPEWMLPMRLRKPPVPAATPIDAPRKRTPPALRTA